MKENEHCARLKTEKSERSKVLQIETEEEEKVWYHHPHNNLQPNSIGKCVKFLQ